MNYVCDAPSLNFSNKRDGLALVGGMVRVRSTWDVGKLGPRHSSVSFSRSVVSDSLQPHGLQHARLPCPSSTPRAYSNSCPWSWWCHPTISSSVVPFSSCFQSFPASGSFHMSLFFASGGQSFAVSALASVLPMNIQDWFPLGWTGWILKSLLQHHSSKASILWWLAFLIVPTFTSIHAYWENHSFD